MYINTILIIWRLVKLPPPAVHPSDMEPVMGSLLLVLRVLRLSSCRAASILGETTAERRGKRVRTWVALQIWISLCVRMHACMHVCMYLCLYVSMCVSVYIDMRIEIWWRVIPQTVCPHWRVLTCSYGKRWGRSSSHGMRSSPWPLLPLNSGIKLLLWHVHVHFDCTSSHKRSNMPQVLPDRAAELLLQILTLTASCQMSMCISTAQAPLIYGPASWAATLFPENSRKNLLLQDFHVHLDCEARTNCALALKRSHKLASSRKTRVLFLGPGISPANSRVDWLLLRSCKIPL